MVALRRFLILFALPASVFAQGIQHDPRPAIDRLGWARGLPPPALLSLPFRSPGCYASGAELGTKGEAVTVVRALGATYESDGLVRTCAANELRVAPAGALVEPARTNQILQSAALDQAVWTKTFATVSANAAAAPDGTLAAEKLVETAVSGEHYAEQTFAGSADNQAWTGSIYAKAGERSWLYLGFVLRDATNVRGGYVDLASGIVGAVAAGYTVTASAVGGGWYRIALTGSVGAGASNARLRAKVTTGDGGTAHLGVAGSGVFLWGGQAELGYPSSYVATVAAAVTRPRDLVTVTGPTDPSLAVFVTATPMGKWAGNERVVFAAGALVGARSLTARAFTDGKLYGYARDDLATPPSPATILFAAEGVWRVGMIVSPLSVTMSINGLRGVPLATGARSSTPSTFYVGAASDTWPEFGGYLRDFVVCRSIHASRCR